MGDYKVRKRIGVFTAQPDAMTEKSMFKGITREAFKYDFDVLFFATAMRGGGPEGYQEGERHAFDMVNWKMLDGAIVFTDVMQISGVKEKLIADIRANFTGPVICVNAEVEGYPYIFEDVHSCMELVLDHLCSVHGCKDFAIMTGPEDHPHGILRRDIALEILAEKGISVPEEDIYYGDFWYDKGDDVAKAILESRGRDHLPDAVFCASDDMAISLKLGFEAIGVKVPTDVIIAGYDSSGSIVHKSITSVEVNDEKLGADAVRYILNELGIKAEPDKCEMDGSLILNATCGCAPNVEYKMIIKDSVEPGYYDGDDFLRGYNFMNEVLQSCSELKLMLWSGLYCAKVAYPFSGFYICLNDSFSFFQDEDRNVELDQIDYSRISDTLYQTLTSKNEDDQLNTVSFDKSFCASEMLPELNAPQKCPHAYFFSLLHFNESIFGYSVISQTSSDAGFDKNYAIMVRNFAMAFESVRKQYELKALYKKIEESAIKDHSTGLFSRNGFNLYSDSLLEHARDYKCNFALILGDLNCLKYINDTFGHASGDVALKVAADTMKTHLDLPVNDRQMNFRIGGDEFVQIIVGDITEEQIQEHIAGIKRKLDDFNANTKLKFPVLMSMGYHILKPTSSDKIDVIMTKADDMMFADKKKLKKETGFDFKRQ